MVNKIVKVHVYTIYNVNLHVRVISRIKFPALKKILKTHTNLVLLSKIKN